MAKILLVDDSPLLLKIGKAALEKGGNTVVTAKDGGEAVAAAKRESPGIVFMDAEMPGVDGLAACRAMKSDPSTRSIPVFICTGHDLTPEQKSLFSAAGADGCLQKPYKPDELLTLVEKHAR